MGLTCHICGDTLKQAIWCARCEGDGDDLQRQLREAQGERDRAREAMSSYRGLMAKRRAERDAVIKRGTRAIHHLCGTSEALREIVATLLVEAETAGVR